MPNNAMKKTPRYLAVSLLERVEKQGTYANLGLDQIINKGHFDSRDAGFLTAIVYGVIQNQMLIDYQLAPFLDHPDKLDNWVVQLLRTAVFQMEMMDKVPKHAIFYESVEIAKVRGHVGIGKFVNGVLRHFERAETRDPALIKDNEERLSITYSIPKDLTHKFVNNFGLTKTESILATVNQPANASMRVNTAITTVDAELAELKEQFPDIRKSEISNVGLVAPGGFIAGTSAFKAGRITIQDESAQLVAPAMQIKKGYQVLDACAAPGGKTTQIATYLEPSSGGRVIAFDIHPNKIRLIEDNADRMQLEDRIVGEAIDARKIDEVYNDAYFDRILVDAPCSGLGLLRRKPEIRYGKTEDDFLKLHQIQVDILESVAKKLKPYGIMTYSTCTIIPEENESVINEFMAHHPEFKIIPVETELPLDKNTAAPFVQIYPDDYGSDGFFIACLQLQSK